MPPRRKLHLLTARNAPNTQYVLGDLVAPDACFEDLVGDGGWPNVGVVWQARGLWCGYLYAHTAWNNKANWLASPCLTTADRVRRYTARFHGRPDTEDWLKQPIKKIVSRFPTGFARNVIAYCVRYPQTPSADGIPWEIHAIDNHIARQAAMKAYLEEQSTGVSINTRDG